MVYRFDRYLTGIRENGPDNIVSCSTDQLVHMVLETLVRTWYKVRLDLNFKRWQIIG